MKIPIDHITIVVTEDCNLQCKYCFEKTKALKSKMSFEVFKRSIEFLCKDFSSPKSITFFGGEPLICADRIIEWSKWLNVYYPNLNKGITTNGMLLTNEIFCELVKENVSILVSIDGYGKEANALRYDFNYYCIWNTWIKNINAIKDKSLLCIRMTVTRFNVHQLFFSIKNFVDMGIKKIAFAIDYYDNWGKDDVELYKEQFEKILQFYYKEYIKNKRFYIDIIEKLILSGIKSIYTKCRLPSDSLTVLPDGHLKVCHRAAQVCGNVMHDIKDTELDLLKNSKGMRGMEECNDCVLRERCTLCPYISCCLPYEQRKIVCHINQFHIKSVDSLISKLYNSGNKFFYDEFYD